MDMPATSVPLHLKLSLVSGNSSLSGLCIVPRLQTRVCDQSTGVSNPAMFSSSMGHINLLGTNLGNSFHQAPSFPTQQQDFGLHHQKSQNIQHQ